MSEIPTSITLSDDSNPSIPSFLSTPLSQKCGKNFIIAEDLQLCRSWLDVSQDPVAGNDQNNTTFWGRVYENFIKYKKTSEERSPKALQSRWTTIQQAVNKFCGYLTQIEMRNQSGITQEDKITNAKLLFSTINKGRSFQFMECWMILRDAKKWQETLAQKEVRYNNNKSEINSNQENNDSLNEIEIRPIGRKAEKLSQKRGKDKIDDFSQDVLNKQDELIEVARKKNKYLKDLIDEAIMSKDLSTMDQDQQSYYKFKRTQILTQMQNDQDN